MDELNEKIAELLSEQNESRQTDIMMLAEEIGKQIVKILIETGLLDRR